MTSLPFASVPLLLASSEQSNAPRRPWDELAAEDDVREEDGEVAAGLGVPALLVQHVPRDGHQVRPVRVRLVVHLAAAPRELSLF